jgi:HTH-type transcriptional regulator/antitoxin HigA
MLVFLMEQQNVQPEDLLGVIGTEKVVAEVIKGKREMTQEQAKAIGKFFKVEPSLFI